MLKLILCLLIATLVIAPLPFAFAAGWLPLAAATCSAPTGQMDFSVCSNIGITAALW
jgi:hypothetical protein